MKLILVIIVLIAAFVFISGQLENFVFAPGPDLPGSSPSLLSPLSVPLTALDQAKSLSRVVGIRKVRTAMEIYSVEWGTYPLVGELCQPITALIKHLVPDYLRGIPEELLQDQGASVAVSGDGLQYVLRTTLSKDTNVSQGGDGGEATKNILGCKCNEPYFCLTELVETNPQFNF